MLSPKRRSAATAAVAATSLPEDPFTGSATGCLAVYLWRHGLIDSPRFVAEQGHWLGRPGTGRSRFLVRAKR